MLSGFQVGRVRSAAALAELRRAVGSEVARREGARVRSGGSWPRTVISWVAELRVAGFVLLLRYARQKKQVRGDDTFERWRDGQRSVVRGAGSETQKGNHG